MSYILDALKKAEAERHLGAVPNLHAQPGSSSSGAPSAFWPKMAIGLVLVALVLVVLMWTRAPVQTGLPPGSAVAAAGAPVGNESAIAPAVPQPLAQPVPQPLAAQNAPPLASATPAPTPTPTPLPAPLPAPVLAQAPVSAKPQAAATAKVPLPTTAPAAPAAAPIPVAKKPEAVPAPVVASGNDEIAPMLADLPEAIQREIPPLGVKGFIHSANPADRVLLVGSGLLHEGDELSPGLRLEKLLPKSAVFSYKGFRYRVAY